MKTTNINITNQIKLNIRLSEVVGKDVALSRKGAEFVGCCPFHHEKTGSFYVNDEKGTYYCFGCGASGDVFEYIMSKKGVTFQQALESLASETGVSLPKFSPNKNHSILKEILTKSAVFFADSLKKNSKAIEYCRKRNLSDEIIDRFMIGFAPNDNISLMKFLNNEGFKDSDILKSGIIKISENKMYCQFRNRIMFPVFEKGNAVIAFGGRAINDNIKPKYLNSSESEFFQKHQVLFGFYEAYKNVDKNKPFIIVEGYIDVITMYRYGFKTAVASMGTSFSEDHLARIWKTCNCPIICFDGDEAGKKAMLKTALMALRFVCPEKSLLFCCFGNQEDPDTFLLKNGSDAMSQKLKRSEYLIDFLWKHFTDQFDMIENKIPEFIEKWKMEIMQTLENIENIGIRKTYKLDIKNRIFKFLYNTRKESTSPTIGVNVVENANNKLLREAFLLYTLIRRPVIIQNVIEELSRIQFENKQFTCIRDFLIENSDIDSTELMERKLMMGDLSLCFREICSLSGVLDHSVEIETSQLEFLWKEVFEKHMVDFVGNNEIKAAKLECQYNMNDSSWKRLRALKIDFIRTRKK